MNSFAAPLAAPRPPRASEPLEAASLRLSRLWGYICSPALNDYWEAQLLQILLLTATTRRRCRVSSRAEGQYGA